MCGIVGCAPPSLIAPVEFDRMVDVLKHRGPDSRGVWKDRSVLLGHRRLSILDPSDRGNQPMANEDASIVIAYNGEVYNHMELRRLLPGVRWRSSCDTETILRLYEKEGRRCLQRLNGMFSIAVHDRRRGHLLLVRDRFGIKPLYLCRQNEAFLFASDCRAFLQWSEFDRSLSNSALREYTLFNYIASSRSIFRNVRHVPPGCLVEYDYATGHILHERWYSGHLEAVRESPSRIDTTTALEQFDELFQDAVHDRTLSDVPVGVFLSGGLDSTAVACALTDSSVPPTTLTVRVEGDKYDEGVWAHRASEVLGANHVDLVFTGHECLSAVEEVPESLGEPFADASFLPQLLLSRLASEHITVALTGDGGDEVFYGYDRYDWLVKVLHRTAHVPAKLRRSIGKLAATLPHYKASILGEGMQFPDNEHAYAYVFAGWNRDQASTLLQTSCVEPLHRITRLSQSAAERSDIGKAAFADLRHYLPGDILTKVDRATMHHSIEARLPFLDHRLVEFALSLPEEAKWKDGKGKHILREWLKRRLPARFIERPKRGFAVPLRDWFRTDLANLVEDMLTPAELERHGLFDKPAVRKLIDLHMTGRWNFERQLWALLVFQLWYNRWVAR